MRSSGRRTHSPPTGTIPGFVGLLILLTIVPATLLVRGYDESRESAAMATDINRSGSLRYRSLFVYAITAAAEHHNEDWRDSRNQMAQIRDDLRRRHPTDIARTDRAWTAFDQSLRQTEHVSWAAAEDMRAAADTLTNTLNGEAIKRSRFSEELFWLGIITLALALPWSLHLTQRLQVSQEETDKQTRSLAQMGARFQDLFQNTPAACIVYDHEGLITEWNRAANDLFEKTANQVVGRFLWDAISRPSMRESAKAAVSRLLTFEESLDFEWQYVAPGGASKTVTTHVIPLYSDEIVIGGISVSTDVTAARAAARSEKQLIANLAESESRLRNVTARSSCLLWEASVVVADAPADYSDLFWDETNRTYLHWDLRILHEEEACRWLPIHREKDQTFSQAWQLSIPEADLRQMNLRSSEALRQGNGSYAHEIPCRLADGSLRWLLENVEFTRSPDAPERWHLVGVCTDISAQKQAQEQLLASTLELQRSNESLQEFAYIASHDLKEPLRKIQTFGGLLERRAGEALPPDCRDYVTRMVSASIRMQALVEGLLDYSQASRKSRSLAQVRLSETVNGVLSDLEEQVHRTRGRVTVGALPTVRADPLQMRQLFQNLISNALKFHKPDESPVIEILWDEREATGLARSEMFTIEVRDNGIGFDQKHAHQIFEMFEQLDTAIGKQSGSGVGLAICRKIVERHGGTIVAHGDPGQGARFLLTLPAA